MGILISFLIVIEVLCSLLLIIAILLQKSKGEGLGMAFGSEMGEALFGTRAGNVLVKATVWLGIIFLVNTAVLAKIYAGDRSRQHERRSLPAKAESQSMPVSPVLPFEGAAP